MEREREEVCFSSLKTIDNKKVLIVKLDINKLPSSSLGLLHSYILIKNFKSKVISILFSLKILKIKKKIVVNFIWRKTKPIYLTLVKNIIWVLAISLSPKKFLFFARNRDLPNHDIKHGPSSF